MSVIAAAGTGLRHWLDPLVERVPGVEIADAHTHLGLDVDGMASSPEDLLAALGDLDASAVTFALHDPAGLRAANTAVFEAAAASGGRLVPFVRLDPADAPLAELERGVAAGARGVKLHPRGQAFGFGHPALDDLFAACAEQRLPILVHAGRGIEPLGADLLHLGRRHPDVPVILAHAAISDLAWLPSHLDELPGVLFDTSWWNAVDLLALFALVPPGRILFASDAPYGSPELNAILTLRCGLAAGLGPDDLESVMGGQLRRLLAGEPLADLGPAPGQDVKRRDVRLDRVTSYLAAAWGCAMAGAPPAPALALALQALALPGDDPLAPVAAAIAELLHGPPCGPMGLGPLAVAAALAATPHVGLPS